MLFKISGIGILIVFLIPLLINIVNNAIYYKDTGNPKPLIESSLGLVVGTESNIYQKSNELGNTTLRQSLPEKYEINYINYLQNSLIESLGIFSIFVFLIFKFLLNILGWAGQVNFFGKMKVLILVLIIMILIISLIEIAYYFLMYKQFFYPFQGVITFIKNFDEIFLQGFKA